MLLLLFSACSPLMTTMPPVPPMSGAELELSAGAHLAAKLGYLGYVEPAGFIADTVDPGVDVALAWHLPGDPRFTIGGVGVGSTTQLGAGGAFFRFLHQPSPRLALSAQVDGGWLWAGASGGIAYRAWEGGWIYTAPGLRLYSPTPGLRLPVGVNIDLSERARLNVEGGWHLGYASAYSDLSAIGSDPDDVQQIFVLGGRGIWAF